MTTTTSSQLTTPLVGPPCPPEFSQAQIDQLERLWDVQTRQVVDVRPNSQATSMHQATYPEPNTHRIMKRLHSFFVAVLRNAMNAAGTEEELRPQTTSNSKNNYSSTTFLKDIRQSCLKSYAQLFLSFDFSSKICLKEGRRVFTVHYEEFMGELNHFEFKGVLNQQILGRDSFGAFLHHFPIQALPAVNASMALAVATVWKEEHAELFATQPSATALKLERFVDRCQLTLRMLHVTPQLPMADVKTGLVRKFISVKVGTYRTIQYGFQEIQYLPFQSIYLI
jgi:hypothetical protein